MADINVKMGVSGISQFKQAMTDAQSSVKNYSAALKMNEAQLKATGDKETYMQNKTTALNAQIAAQKRVVDNARAAYQQLISNGADPMSKACVDMQTKFYQANTELINMTESLKDLESGEKTAATETTNLSTGLNNLGKKVSLDQVIDGIDSITGALEKAGKKAVEVGEQIWNTILNAAQWSDDTATAATMYGVDVEEYQKMVKVFDTTADITADAYFKARQKIKKAVNDGSQDQIDAFEALGIKTTEGESAGKYGEVEGVARDWEEVFWEAGDALKSKVASGELSQDMADVYAQALFGKGFAELNPLFEMGEDSFKEAVDQQTAATQEAVENNAALNDSVVALKNEWNTFLVEVLGQITPELTKVTDSLSGLLSTFTEYAQSDEGQEMLKKIGEAVGSLFTDLTSIDPDAALQGLQGVFSGIREAMEWISNNSGAVIGAMQTIVAGWAALKVTGGVLEIAKIISGIQGLTGAASGAATAGAAAGSAWGGAFASAAGVAIKAVPWLAGIITLLTPADTAGNDLDEIIDEATGQLTEAGKAAETAAADTEQGVNFEDRSTPTTKHTQNEGTTFASIDIPGWFGNMYSGMVEGVRNWHNGLLEADAWNFGDMSLDDIMAQINAENGEEPTIEVKPEIPEDWNFGDEYTAEELQEILFGDENPEVEVDPKAEENAAADLAEQIGTVEVPVKLTLSGGGASGGGFTSYALSLDGSGLLHWKGHANGLDYVPFDGYPALLHKGERVVTAREANNNNYNSNLYVESMYMNNGTDAQALAAAMAAANRRTRAGYGS